MEGQKGQSVGELRVGTRHSGSSHGTLSKELFPREVKFPGRKFVLYYIQDFHIYLIFEVKKACIISCCKEEATDCQRHWGMCSMSLI